MILPRLHSASSDSTGGNTSVSTALSNVPPKLHGYWATPAKPAANFNGVPAPNSKISSRSWWKPTSPAFEEMKIALFHNLPSGGAKRVVYEHARRLQALGHRLDLYTFETVDEKFLPLQEFVTKTVRFPWLESPHSGGMARRFLRLRRIEQWHEEIAQAINKEGYDVAYLHTCLSTGEPMLPVCSRFQASTTVRNPFCMLLPFVQVYVNSAAADSTSSVNYGTC